LVQACKLRSSFGNHPTMLRGLWTGQRGIGVPRPRVPYIALVASIKNHRGILGGALDQPKLMLCALIIDAQPCSYQRVFGQLDAVDLHLQQFEPRGRLWPGTVPGAPPTARRNFPRRQVSAPPTLTRPARPFSGRHRSVKAARGHPDQHQAKGRTAEDRRCIFRFFNISQDVPGESGQNETA